MKKYRLIFALSLFTAVGTALYWILVFIGVFPVIESVSGFTVWFYSFPLADSWIIVTSLMLAISLKQKKTKSSIVWSLLSASGMIFLALNGFLFGYNTGLLFMMTIDEIIEIAIKIYCIVVGAYFIYYARNQLTRIDY
jgi:hypothetical protein